MLGTKKSYCLGIDIGGTRLKSVVIDSEKHQILDSHEQESDAQKGPEAVLNAVVSAVNHHGKDLFTSIGIGCAGSVEPKTGVVRNSPNFSHWRNVPLGKWVNEKTGLPVIVENDANCAVYAEWKMGAAKGFQNVVLLTIGTGIGGGLILNERLYRGSTHTGGEIGHFSIYANGCPCPCGNTGCFERYCSASALREMGNNLYSAREIFTRREEPACAQIIQQFMKDFKIALTSLSNIFDPDCILIGGGVAEGLSAYFPEISEWLKQHAFPAVGSHVQIRATQFGNLSGAIGAGLLDWLCTVSK